MFSIEEEKIIENTKQFVKSTLAHQEAGHDWSHIERVFKNTQNILKNEPANAFVCLLSALLHDIADSKFHDGNEEIGPATAKAFLETISVSPAIVQQVTDIIRQMSFKQSLEENVIVKSPELCIVQDADRLDAIGAIGIARTFNYGGFKNRKLHDPEIPPALLQSKEDYKKSTAPTINHFYEKLLLLKDQMNTETGLAMAQKRHDFMLEFLNRFLAEWEGQEI